MAFKWLCLCSAGKLKKTTDPYENKRIDWGARSSVECEGWCLGLGFAILHGCSSSKLVSEPFHHEREMPPWPTGFQFNMVGGVWTFLSNETDGSEGKGPEITMQSGYRWCVVPAYSLWNNLLSQGFGTRMKRITGKSFTCHYNLKWHTINLVPASNELLP